MSKYFIIVMEAYGRGYSIVVRGADRNRAIATTEHYQDAEMIVNALNAQKEREG